VLRLKAGEEAAADLSAVVSKGRVSPRWGARADGVWLLAGCWKSTCHSRPSTPLAASLRINFDKAEGGNP